MRSLFPAFFFSVLLAGCSSGSNSGGGHLPPAYAFPAASTLQFVTQFGTQTYDAATMQGDTVTAVAQDSEGNIFVAGYTAGNLSGYSGTVGILKAVLYKLDSKGNHIWSRELTTGAGDTLAGVVVEGNSIVVVGDTKGAYSGWSNPSAVSEVFVAWFDESGNQTNLVQYTSSQSIELETVAADSSEDILLAGEVYDISGGQDLLVEKLNSAGAPQWQKTYGSGAVDVIMGVTTDSSGNVYAVGTTDGVFPGGPSNAQGMPFVLKLDGGSGSSIWMEQFSSDSALSAMYPSAVFATGTSLYVEGSVGSYGTNAQVVLAQIDSGTGLVNWKFLFGAGAENLPGQSIVMDSSGEIYCAGMTFGALASGVTNGIQDVFLARVSPSGTPIWAQQIGTGTDGPALANTGSTPIFLSAGSENVVLAGMTSGQFPGFTNTNNAVELFVASFNP